MCTSACSRLMLNISTNNTCFYAPALCMPLWHHGWFDRETHWHLLAATTATALVYGVNKITARVTRWVSGPLSTNQHSVWWNSSFLRFKIATAHFPFAALLLIFLTKSMKHWKFWILYVQKRMNVCVRRWRCVINVLWWGAIAQWQLKTTYWLLILPVNGTTGHPVQTHTFSLGG